MRIASQQRGSTIVVMMIVLVGLGTIAGLTVISVQSGSATTNTHRFTSMAKYAAESGAAVTMDWLRDNAVLGPPATLFSAYVTPSNIDPVKPPVPGNGVEPGDAGNLISLDQRGWYDIVLLNNKSDPGFADPDGVYNDTDGIVIIEVTGHGPNGAVSKIQWEVKYDSSAVADGRNPLTLIGWRELM